MNFPLKRTPESYYYSRKSNRLLESFVFSFPTVICAATSGIKNYYTHTYFLRIAISHEKWQPQWQSPWSHAPVDRVPEGTLTGPTTLLLSLLSSSSWCCTDRRVWSLHQTLFSVWAHPKVWAQIHGSARVDDSRWLPMNSGSKHLSNAINALPRLSAMIWTKLSQPSLYPFRVTIHSYRSCSWILLYTILDHWAVSIIRLLSFDVKCPNARLFGWSEYEHIIEFLCAPQYYYDPIKWNIQIQNYTIRLAP